ncbi:hypothetical protein HK104_004827, partial [Borealophlyctis nickersoniae]
MSDESPDTNPFTPPVFPSLNDYWYSQEDFEALFLSKKLGRVIKVVSGILKTAAASNDLVAKTYGAETWYKLYNDSMHFLRQKYLSQRKRYEPKSKEYEELGKRAAEVKHLTDSVSASDFNRWDAQEIQQGSATNDALYALSTRAINELAQRESDEPPCKKPKHDAPSLP